MRKLNSVEISQVSGGLNWGEGGLAIIALGFAGGPVTAGFGLAIGGSMIYTSYRFGK